MSRGLVAAGLLVGIVARVTFGQDAANPGPTVQARADDVNSIDAIVAAFYDTVSGEKGVQRDWDRLRSLFAPDARMVLAVPARNGASARIRSIPLEDFIKRADASSRQEAFYESETARRVDQFGCMANVWSTYESRTGRDGAPFSRGINSFELFFDGSRWWVVSIYWTTESPSQPIPDQYKPGAKENRE